MDRVLAGRTPTVADVDALPYVLSVVTESMRLFPPRVDDRPARQVACRSSPATRCPDGAGLHQPVDNAPRCQVLCESGALHPERWTPEFKAALPRHAYFPFGGGPRTCIGEAFAWMELVLIVATIAQRWELHLVPGHPVATQPLLTLRATHGMRMTLHART